MTSEATTEGAGLRAEWVAVECMRFAQIVRTGSYTADSPETTAQEIFDWTYAKQEVALALAALRACIDNRTGGASVEGILRKADETYSFACKMRQRAEGKPSVVGGTPAKKVLRKKASKKRVATKS
jgi:hypothetical protein